MNEQNIGQTVAAGLVLLEAQDLTAGYADGFALRDISFRVHAGEALGVVGPNGSGKSTLLRALSGFLSSSSGAVLLEGRPVDKMSITERAQRMACVPQGIEMPVAFTVREIVSLGRLPYVSGWMPLRAQDRRIIERSMSILALTHMADRPLNELSAGERQRALIAMAMTQEPRVMLLDEPTAHMDVEHAVSLMRLIMEMTRAHHIAAVVSLHDLNLAAAFCDRIMLLDAGRIVAQGNAAEVLTPDTLARVYRLPFERLPRSDGTALIAPVYGASGAVEGSAAGAKDPADGAA